MKLTVSHRLMLSLSIALAALLFTNAYGWWALNKAQERFAQVQSNVVPSIVDLAAIQNASAVLRDLGLEHALAPSAHAKDEAEKNILTQVATLDQLFEKYQRDDVLGDPVDQTLVDTDRSNYREYRKSLDVFIDRSRAGDLDSVRTMAFNGGVLTRLSTRIKSDFDKHMAYNIAQGVDAKNANDQSFAHTVWLLSAVIFSAFIATIASGLRLYNIVGGGLERMKTKLEDVSRTLDLSRKVPVQRMDEFGQSAVALNGLLERVSDAMTVVSVSAESVTVASREIATGNTDLAARTGEQAASLEETAASMTQLTETVKQNADNARHAKGLATNASDLADTGYDAVQAMVDTIEKIRGSSSKISDITGVIEGIAFQTNILALNAAVEAARAGEQGRGFAVVASEVRSLAQRSSVAAKEIKGLIELSVVVVQDGSKQASEVGATMGQVKQAIKRVSDIVSEIAAASDEQSCGIEQVDRAVGQMDEVTQQNAALVEQAAAAAQSLEEQAKRLKEAVSVFKVADTGQSAIRMTIPLPASRTPVTRGTESSKLRIASTSIDEKHPKTVAETAKADWETF